MPLLLTLLTLTLLLCNCWAEWHNDALAKYPTQLKRLQTASASAGSSSSMLLDAITRSHTHVYAIVTSAEARQNHMREFVTSVLQLPFPPATADLPSSPSKSFSSPHFDLVSAVEISPTIPLDSFVRTGVLSKDYNATWRHQRMNHGRLACQLSLVHTLQLFLNSSNKYALIFEDDVVVTGGLTTSDARSLTAQMLVLPAKQWDIQYLGYCHSCQSRGSYPPTQWLSDDVVALCAHAIVFNRKAASVFLQRWSPLHSPGDNKLSQVVCQTGLKVLRPVLPIFDQDRSLGQSQTGTKNKPLRPFLDPEVCRVRQMNCPSIIAAESLNRPAGRSSSMTWFNSVRSRGDRAGRTNTKSTRYKRLNNAAA